MNPTSLPHRFLVRLVLLVTALSLGGCRWGGDDPASATAPPSNYTIGGNLAGLTTTGLVLANGSDTLAPAANATTFTFAKTVASGTTYAVTVQTQPSSATCSVNSSSGSVGTMNVTSVSITCVTVTHSLGGTIGGLSGGGLVLGNGTDTVAPAAGATTFTFATAIAEGAAYSVTVQTQPAGDTCVVSGGSGTMATAAVTSVHVTCSPKAFHVGGTLSGLTAPGLILANGTDTVSPAASATTFIFAKTVATGASYSVAVQQQPTGLTCTVSGSYPATMPSADVTDVAVTCSTASGLVPLAGQASCPSGAGAYADGTGAAASLPETESMTMDAAGNIYSVNAGARTLRRLTPTGVVTTVAGVAHNGGVTDGNGANARFEFPDGVAVDAADNVTVVDSSAIRHVTATADVTTLAGSNTQPVGFVDGPGSTASFNGPRDVAISSNGDLFVTDSGNHVIRRITPAGVVSTFAGGGAPGAHAPGFVDGTGTAAMFDAPVGLAIDSADNLYVADDNNQSIRKITPAGVVTTLAGGGPSNPGFLDGTGAAARFGSPRRIRVGANGNLYVTDQIGDQTPDGGISGAIRLITPAGVVTTIAAQVSLHSSAPIQVPGGVNGIATNSSGALYVAFGCAIAKVGP